MKKFPLPIPRFTIISFLALLLILTALLSGYYHSLYQTEVRKSKYSQAKFEKKIELLQEQIIVLEKNSQ